MRHSRRATIAACGQIWEKYEYNYVLVKDLVGYSTEIVERGVWDTNRTQISGYSDYDIVRTNGKYYDHYEFVFSDFVIYEIDDAPCSVFNEGSFANTVDHDRLSANGEFSFSTIYLTNEYENERYEWWVEDYVGTTRAEEDSYPDAGRGYTFVKMDGDYTIMTDGEKYYAYKLRG